MSLLFLFEIRRRAMIVRWRDKCMIMTLEAATMRLIKIMKWATIALRVALVRIMGRSKTRLRMVEVGKRTVIPLMSSVTRTAGTPVRAAVKVDYRYPGLRAEISTREKFGLMRPLRDHSFRFDRLADSQ